MLSVNDSIVTVLTFLFLSETLISMSKEVKAERERDRQTHTHKHTHTLIGLETKVRVSLCQVRRDRPIEM